MVGNEKLVVRPHSQEPVVNMPSELDAAAIVHPGDDDKLTELGCQHKVPFARGRGMNPARFNLPAS